MSKHSTSVAPVLAAVRRFVIPGPSAGTRPTDPMFRYTVYEEQAGPDAGTFFIVAPNGVKWNVGKFGLSLTNCAARGIPSREVADALADALNTAASIPPATPTTPDLLPFARAVRQAEAERDRLDCDWSRRLLGDRWQARYVAAAANCDEAKAALRRAQSQAQSAPRPESEAIHA